MVVSLERGVSRCVVLAILGDEAVHGDSVEAFAAVEAGGVAFGDGCGGGGGGL